MIDFNKIDYREWVNLEIFHDKSSEEIERLLSDYTKFTIKLNYAIQFLDKRLEAIEDKIANL